MLQVEWTELELLSDHLIPSRCLPLCSADTEVGGLILAHQVTIIAPNVDLDLAHDFKGICFGLLDTSADRREIIATEYSEREF